MFRERHSHSNPYLCYSISFSILDPFCRVKTRREVVPGQSFDRALGDLLTWNQYTVFDEKYLPGGADHLKLSFQQVSEAMQKSNKTFCAWRNTKLATASSAARTKFLGRRQKISCCYTASDEAAPKKQPLHVVEDFPWVWRDASAARYPTHLTDVFKSSFEVNHPTQKCLSIPTENLGAIPSFLSFSSFRTFIRFQNDLERVPAYKCFITNTVMVMIAGTIRTLACRAKL